MADPRPATVPERDAVDFDITRELSVRALEILGAARLLLERDGWEELSMRMLGEQVGIRAPSLYKHYRSKHALRVALATVALAESGARLHAVVRAGGGVADLLAAYRDQAHRNPHLYRLATVGTLPRTELPDGLEDWAGEPFFRVCGGEPHLAQALWSIAHGMTILELDRRYPTGQEPEQTWQVTAALFTSAVEQRGAGRQE